MEEKPNFEESLEFQCLIKSFVWYQEYLGVFSTYAGDFKIFDIRNKEFSVKMEREEVVAGMYADQEQIYCGFLKENKIEVFDAEKQIFQKLYEQEEETKITLKSTHEKIYRNKDKTLVTLRSRAKTHFINIFDFRDPKPLISEKELPMAIEAFDICQNLMAVAWESKKREHFHSIIDVSRIWPQEKDFEMALKKDIGSKLSSEDFHTDQKISSVRVSPSKLILSVGRENGSVYLYDLGDDISSIFQKSQLFFAARLNDPRTSQNEGGKLPEREQAKIIDMDFFPRNEGKEDIIVSSGSDGILKFLNFEKPMFLKSREIEKNENLPPRYFERVKWSPRGDVLMVLKSPNSVKSGSFDCQMRFTESPIRPKNNK